ncbi:MAG: hypothetical protein CLLPBCKN_007422 [Chroococcidiopsis cubana SAG 39.79]|uniref:DUF305 domain-containing protein n=2 Tax=Chroococcidiopsis TaxID=54298 RepID=A0AB37UBC9_9CYAN|nr:hypothetical protein [Chroococcidiopsis cubana SAG 39.79]PSB62284.1 DUF305 domain-containing protein [Chroococcidiopsis cubana CCALA 043]RUT04186.1 hypothetical protein DSM107010_58230 [Chroococcidiopsis cubana SAG 39.79]
MQPNSTKTKFLALTLAAIATMTSGLLAASFGALAKDSKTSNTTNAHLKQNMQHGSGMMNHGSGMMNHGSGMMQHGSGMSMDLGPADAYYDLRFIDGMRLHHRGAIAMAKEAQLKSKRPEIKKLAGNIIIAQNREENELLRKWRQQWYPQASKEPVAYGGEGKPVVPMTKQQQQSMSMMMDLGTADAQFDLRFMNAMIAHHEGAVMMAQDALQKSKRPEIKQLANEIVTSQQKEIAQMMQWRKAWYNQ